MNSTNGLTRSVMLGLLVVAVLALGCSPDEPEAMVEHDHSAMDQMSSQGQDDHSAHAGHDMASMDEQNPREDVHLSSAAIQSIGVRYATAKTESLSHVVRTTGRFAMDEQAEYDVTLKVSGYIENLQADYNGKQVQRGEHLFDLYSPELVATQEELLTAVRHLNRLEGLNASPESIEQADRVVEAVTRRLSLWDVDGELIDSMLDSGKPLRVIPFFAPVNGEIMQKQVSEGSHVMVGQSVMRIVDISKTWLVVDSLSLRFCNHDAGRCRLDQRA